MTGIPSISAFVLSAVLLSVGCMLTFGYFTTLDKFDTPTILLGVFIIGYSSFITYLLITRLRVLRITENAIKIFYPLLLKNKEIKITEIVNLNWRLRGTIEYGDFKELNIENKDKSIIKLTDFEFGNLDKLENYLLSSLNLKPNLTKKREVEVLQANGNNLLTIFATLFCLTLIILTLIKISNNGHVNLGAVIVILVCSLLTVQFTSSLLKYKEILKDYKKARKKRTKLD